MKRKIISPASMLGTGILLLTGGILLLVSGELLWLVGIFLPIVLAFVAVGKLAAFLWNKGERRMRVLGTANLYFVLALIAAFAPFWTTVSIVRVVGLWAIISATISAITAYLKHRDGDRGVVSGYVEGAISLIFGVLLIWNPASQIKLVTIFAGIYLIFGALTLFRDFVREVWKLDLDGKYIKRRLRVSMPVFAAAFLPMKLVGKINELVRSAPPKAMIAEAKEGAKSESGRLEIFVHMAPDVAMGFGHVDISFDGVTYSYGTYDQKSNRFFGLISDGVLMEAPTAEYVEFCTRSKKRTLLCYTLAVSELQADAVKARIEQIKSRAVQWHCEGEDETAMLAKTVGAKYFKFKSGAFKTYFTVTTNCVKIADSIVGSAGLDLLGINGIITPGTYFSYLERMFERQNTLVVKRTVYCSREESR